MKTIIAFAYLYIVFLLNANVYPQTKQEGDEKYTLDNCISEFSMDKTVKTDAGYQFWYIDKNFADGKTLKLSVVGPNSATHAPHVHPEDEIFYILEGKAEVYLAGEWRSIEANTSFYCPSNVEHGIRNPGDKELKYLVIKKYDVIVK
jgi:quercetin dioxygenase-like cupin family protein